MKLAVAFLAIIVTLGFGACSTDHPAAKEVIFNPCCMTVGAQPKDVTLIGSFEPGTNVTVVHLVH